MRAGASVDKGPSHSGLTLTHSQSQPVLGGDGQRRMQVEAFEMSLHRCAVLGARGLGIADAMPGATSRR